MNHDNIVYNVGQAIEALSKFERNMPIGVLVDSYSVPFVIEEVSDEIRIMTNDTTRENCNEQIQHLGDVK